MEKTQALTVLVSSSIFPANNKPTNGQANAAVTEHASIGQSKSSFEAVKDYKTASKVHDGDCTQDRA